MTFDATPVTHDDRGEVRRETTLPAPPEDVLAALDDPELLSAWIGPWHRDDDIETVVTDDGVERSVEQRRVDERGARWTWFPVGDPSAASDVELVVQPVEGGSRLTVVERPHVRVAPASASAAAISVTPWTANMLALGAVMTCRRLTVV